jgi:mannan endo-1,4-beta-mannosidase
MSSGIRNDWRKHDFIDTRYAGTCEQSPHYTSFIGNKILTSSQYSDASILRSSLPLNKRKSMKLPRRTTASLGALLTCVALFVCLTHPVSAANGTLLGVYYGNQGWKIEQIQAMESWQGKRHAVVNMFANWCGQTKTMDNLFNQQLVNIWNNKNVPMITWEPYICNTAGTPDNVEMRAANGEYDTYFNTWAIRLKTFLSGPDGTFGTGDDRRAYLRLAHEMNGDWYPWGAVVGGNSPADYVNMWRRVRGIFDGKGLDATHLQWVWCVNHDDVGGFTAEQYYPGDAYVDWVAVDGYNWGLSQSWSAWKTPAQTYDPMISRLRTITTKPLNITEAASTSTTATGPSMQAKSQWITDFYAYVATNNIKMVIWFNEDKETDWAVFGGGNGDGTYRYGRTTYKTYAAYKTAVGSSNLIPSDSANLRLLTDAQFAGL